MKTAGATPISHGGACPSLGARLAIALSVALLASAIAALKLRLHGSSYVAGDFTTFWRGARALLDGQSPYLVINPLGPFPFDSGFLYPLPAAVTVLPFAGIDVRTAMPLFSGICAGVLAYAFTADGYWRLPLLMSFPMLWCVSSGQWAPLFVAAAILRGWGWVAAIKPTLGLAAFAYRLSWRFVVLGLLFVGLSAVLWPWWPREWLAEVARRDGGNYHIPLLHPIGPVLLLGFARWRRPEARVLLAMSVIPQTVLFYEQLPLALVAQTFRQSLIFGLVSYLPYVLASIVLGPGDHSYTTVFPVTARLILFLYYLPALVIVLRRPNVGDTPRWAERLLAPVDHWLGERLGDP